MRQTDIKTIYLSTEELKQAIVDFVEQHSIELAQLVRSYEMQLALTEEGLTLRVVKEVETLNTEPEYIVNDEK
jgi:hypothetical protein